MVVLRDIQIRARFGRNQNTRSQFKGTTETFGVQLCPKCFQHLGMKYSENSCSSRVLATFKLEMENKPFDPNSAKTTGVGLNLRCTLKHEEVKDTALAAPHMKGTLPAAPYMVLRIFCQLTLIWEKYFSDSGLDCFCLKHLCSSTTLKNKRWV